MKQTSWKKGISASLLAVLAIQPLATSAFADMIISGNTAVRGGIQVNKSITLQIIGSPTIEGTVVVTKPFAITAEDGNRHTAFQHADYVLRPTDAGMRIDFGGVTTGTVTIGNDNVGSIDGADGITRIQYAKEVTQKNAVLHGTLLDGAIASLQGAIAGVNVTDAKRSQDAYELAKGDTNASAYKQVAEAVSAVAKRL